MESREPSSGLQHEHSSDSCSCCYGIEVSVYRVPTLTLPSSSEDLNPNLLKELAIKVLTYYQDTKGLKLEISGEVTIANHNLNETCCGFHLAFEATSQDGDLKSVLAEVFQQKEGHFGFINFCTVMDPSDPDVVKGCCACPEAILHPNGVDFFKYPDPDLIC